MKIITVIAEYNPFHNGHEKHLKYIKEKLKADKIIVLLSGNFTQRGEPAVLNKFVRAKCAVNAGADLVIELPSVFSTSNAETFSKGAISIIDDLNVSEGICFGVESGEKEEYLTAANILNNEDEEFKTALKEELKSGVSLAKAKFNSAKKTKKELNENLMASPNNVLGLEYVKAIINKNSSLNVYPVIRHGDHNDESLKKNVTSALSIRKELEKGDIKKVKGVVPDYVYKELKTPPLFDKIILSGILTDKKEKLKALPDCTEGLENRLKSCVNNCESLEEFVEKVSTKRYTKTRIKRICVSNLLGITLSLQKSALNKKSYAKVLAVKKESLDLLSLIEKSSSIPLLTRRSDLNKLNAFQKKCFSLDELSVNLYNLVANEKENPYQMLII